jgi:hypothetical protein
METQHSIRQLIAYYQVQGCYKEAKILSVTSLDADGNQGTFRNFYNVFRIYKVYRAEAYVDDGIQSWLKQGVLIEYETFWSARRWFLFPMWAIFSDLPQVPLGVVFFIVIGWILNGQW